MRSTDAERNNLLLQAPVPTALLTGPEHVFQLANSLYCRMVGRTQLVGKKYLEAFPSWSARRCRACSIACYRTGEPFVTEELSVPLDRRGNGARRRGLLQVQPRAPAGRQRDVYGMMAVAVEITEQVRRASTWSGRTRAREAAASARRAAARAKDEFLAMLGHELRNPLSPISRRCNS